MKTVISDLVSYFLHHDDLIWFTRFLWCFTDWNRESLFGSNNHFVCFTTFEPPLVFTIDRSKAVVLVLFVWPFSGLVWFVAFLLRLVDHVWHSDHLVDKENWLVCLFSSVTFVCSFPWCQLQAMVCGFGFSWTSSILFNWLDDSFLCEQFINILCHFDPIYEPQSHKTYLWTCMPTEDSDQPAHSRNLIRIFTGRILDSQGCKVLFM